MPSIGSRHAAPRKLVTCRNIRITSAWQIPVKSMDTRYENPGSSLDVVRVDLPAGRRDGCFAAAAAVAPTPRRAQ
jgi:hypothetical protein